MNVVFDTNVILDVLLNREPFARAAANLLARAERGDIHGFVCATSVTTIFYFARKHVGAAKAREQLEGLLSILHVAPVTRKVVEAALESNISDFEDAVIVESSRQVQAHCVVTRNEGDFEKSPIAIYTPAALVALLDTLANVEDG